jgi:hypothetical protein
MSFIDNLKNRLKNNGVSDEDAETKAIDAVVKFAVSEEKPKVEAPVVVNFAETAEFKAMQNVIDAQTAQFAAMNETIASLKQSNEAITAKSKETEVQAKFSADSAEIDALAKSGKITPAEGESFKTLAKDHPAAFATILPTLQAKSVLAQFSDVAAKKTFKPMAGSPSAELESLTKARMAETKETYKVAFAAVASENVGLVNAQHAIHMGNISNGVEN